MASNIQIKTDKRGTSYFSMSVMGKGISATVSITLPKGTDQASVTVNPLSLIHIWHIVGYQHYMPAFLFNII